MQLNNLTQGIWLNMVLKARLLLCLTACPIASSFFFIVIFPPNAQIFNACIKGGKGQEQRIRNFSQSLQPLPAAIGNEGWKPPYFLLRLPFPTGSQTDANTQPCLLKSTDKLKIKCKLAASTAKS